MRFFQIKDYGHLIFFYQPDTEIAEISPENLYEVIIQQIYYKNKLIYSLVLPRPSSTAPEAASSPEAPAAEAT